MLPLVSELIKESRIKKNRIKISVSLFLSLLIFTHFQSVFYTHAIFHNNYDKSIVLKIMECKIDFMF